MVRRRSIRVVGRGIRAFSRLVLVGSLCAGGLLASGCTPPIPPGAIRDADGDVIRLDLLSDIVNDPDLTEEEQRQQLRALGLNEDLVELLIRNL